jgi:hypothetical protein
MNIDRSFRVWICASTTLVAATISVIAVAGCGGGGSGLSAAAGDSSTLSGDSSSKPLTKAELVARADATCMAEERAFRAATRKFYPQETTVPNAKERLPNVGYSENLIEISKRAVDRLKSLIPPPQLRADYEAYLRAEEEVEQLAEEALKASIADNGGAYFKARKTRDAGALERYDLASAVGLAKCSPNPFR